MYIQFQFIVGFWFEVWIGNGGVIEYYVGEVQVDVVVWW